MKINKASDGRTVSNGIICHALSAAAQKRFNGVKESYPNAAQVTPRPCSHTLECRGV
jgi:hypothetical protein